MFKSKLLLFLSLTFLSGCILSFHPLFSNEEFRYDAGLIGVWNTGPKTEEDSIHTDAKISISRAPVMDNAYTLEIDRHEGVTGRYMAQLGFIGTNRFLQIAPIRPANIHPKTLFGGHFIAAWSFWKLELKGDRMNLYDMNESWFEDMLKAKKLEIKHEQEKGGFLVLTASPSELKEFIAKHQGDQGFYIEKLTLTRQK